MNSLLANEQFTNIQRAQAGLTKLLQKAEKTKSYYRVMKNDEPLGVLIPNQMWEDFVEDIEAMNSLKFLASVKKARKEKTSYSMEEVKTILGL